MLLIIAAFAAILDFSSARGIGGCKILDLTHPLSGDTPVYPIYKPFSHRIVQEGPAAALGVEFLAWGNFCSYEHTGTHMDAPWHFAKNGQKVDEVPLTSLVGEACVIDIQHKQKDGPVSLTLTDIKAWESKYGKLGPECLLLVATGQAKHFFDAKRYFGTQDITDASSFSFASFGADTAQYIVDSGVKAIGVDAISIDEGGAAPAVHVKVLGANIPGFENLNNLHLLPPRGASIMAAPTLIKGGSGAALRAFAVGWQENDPCSVGNMFSAATRLSWSHLLYGALALVIAQYF